MAPAATPPLPAPRDNPLWGRKFRDGKGPPASTGGPSYTLGRYQARSSPRIPAMVAEGLFSGSAPFQKPGSASSLPWGSWAPKLNGVPTMPVLLLHADTSSGKSFSRLRTRSGRPSPRIPPGRQTNRCCWVCRGRWHSSEAPSGRQTVVTSAPSMLHAASSTASQAAPTAASISASRGSSSAVRSRNRPLSFSSRSKAACRSTSAFAALNASLVRFNGGQDRFRCCFSRPHSRQRSDVDGGAGRQRGRCTAEEAAARRIDRRVCGWRAMHAISLDHVDSALHGLG